MLNITSNEKGNSIGQALELKAAIEYYKGNILPYFNDMEEWVKNEYHTSFCNNAKELENTKKYIKKHEAVFNETLSKYNLTVTTFIAKYL